MINELIEDLGKLDTKALGPPPALRGGGGSNEYGGGGSVPQHPAAAAAVANGSNSRPPSVPDYRNSTTAKVATATAAAAALVMPATAASKSLDLAVQSCHQGRGGLMANSLSNLSSFRLPTSDSDVAERKRKRVNSVTSTCTNSAKSLSGTVETPAGFTEQVGHTPLIIYCTKKVILAVAVVQVIGHDPTTLRVCF